MERGLQHSVGEPMHLQIPPLDGIDSNSAPNRYKCQSTESKSQEVYQLVSSHQERSGTTPSLAVETARSTTTAREDAIADSAVAQPTSTSTISTGIFGND
jgi:hypothetical protein